MCSVTTASTVVLRPPAEMVGYATKLCTVPVSTASAPLGSATILYPVREINSRPMSVGKRRASLYREVTLPNAGIAIVWIVLGSMSPCPDTWYPHPAVSANRRDAVSIRSGVPVAGTCCADLIPVAAPQPPHSPPPASRYPPRTTTPPPPRGCDPP